MSLSKYFKDSSSFQREDILKSKQGVENGWKPTGQQIPTKPFEANQKIKQSINHQETGQNRSSSQRAGTGSEKSQNTPGVHQQAPTAPLNQDKNRASQEQIQPNVNQSPNSGGLPDPNKFIEISAVKAKMEEAYEQGFQNATEKAEEDYGSATKSMTAICQQLETVRETLITNSSHEILDFAITIAERILRYSLKESRVTVIATIEEALQKAVKSDEFYIYVNPDDFETVVEKSDELIAGLSGLNNIVIKKDITIEPGGAKIESENCTIDATIASQFEVIIDDIKKRQ